MAKEIKQPLRKATFAIEGDRAIYSGDVIELDGEFWLVPAWLERPGGLRRQPERIIQMKWLVPDPPTTPDQDFFLPDPLPRSVVSGQLPHSGGPLYNVVGMPDLFLSTPKHRPGVH